MPPVRLIQSAALLAALAVIAPSSAWAEECPTSPPTDARMRRQEAKRWFDRAQRVQAGGDETEALRAYQCSLSIVSHPFTAFNVARLADKLGDADTAVVAYRVYLQLAPNAPDLAKVTARIQLLSGEASAQAAGGSNEPPPKPRPLPVPIAAEPAAATSEPIRRDERQVAEPDSASDAGARPAASDSSSESTSSPLRVTGWILTASGTALVATGAVLNLLARDDMNACRARYLQGDRQAAEDACDSARPLAYSSYVAMGTGAAAAAAGVVLWYVAARADRTADRERPLAWVAPLPGGALVAGRFRF